ncbi:IS1595 family transposase [Pengzhenrongella phosphoraccumulans]|uniref:IS1595 family transposase n=1 Tax=Pengzhenrongella phosphoraccumulans TaxID=3114394 RepID=UPI00388D1A9B
MDEASAPVAGVGYPSTHQQLVSWFPDDDACADYLAKLRWPNGFECPHCHSTNSWRTARRGMWMCADCSKQTSVTAGTIFHRSHTPLSTWFAAIWFVCASKNGISAATLQQILGFRSYETAWAWLHKLRRVMVRPERDLLSGTVELDEAMIGGRSKGRPGAGSTKVPVMIAVEVTDGRKIGRIRLGLATAKNSDQLVDFAHKVIAPGSTIRSDGAPALRKLADEGFTHEFHVMVSAAEPAHEHLPGVHLVASLLKRWIAGTMHHGIAKRQLVYYLDEFTFRFNRRKSRSRGLLFYRLLQQAVATDPHPLTSLVGGAKPL